MIWIDKDRLCWDNSAEFALVLQSAFIFVSQLAELENIINTARLCKLSAY